MRAATQSLGVAWLALFLVHAAARADEPNAGAGKLAEIRRQLDKLDRRLEQIEKRYILVPRHENDPLLGLRSFGASVGSSRLIKKADDLLGKVQYRVIYRAGDQGMHYLDRFNAQSIKRIVVLDLSSSLITDAGMVHLKGLRNLHKLDLSSTNITDRGIANLADLTQLEELHLSDTKLTGAGMKTLAKLKRLRWLYLNGTRITDESFVHLAGLSNLERLEIADLGRSEDGDEEKMISGDGLKHLTGLKRLSYLYLYNTDIDDDHVRHFAKMRGLRDLFLGVQNFGDRGLAHLKNLTQLEMLEGGVTRQQERELKKALPDLFIYNP